MAFLAGVQVRSQIVTGDAADALYFKHMLRWHRLPLVNRLARKVERQRKRSAPASFLYRFFDRGLWLFHASR